jgi:hypothetical protein
VGGGGSLYIVSRNILELLLMTLISYEASWHLTAVYCIHVRAFVFQTTSANCMAVGENFIFIGCAEGIVRCFSPSTLQFVTTLPRTHYLGVDVAQGLSIRFVVIEYSYVLHCCGYKVHLRMATRVIPAAIKLCFSKK